MSFRLSNWVQRVSRPVRRDRPIKARATFRPMLLALEDRLLPAAIHWINPAGGNWSAASNWDLNRVPLPADDVSITNAGSGVVTHGTGTDSVHSLTCTTRNLDTTGGALTVTNGFTESGNHSLTAERGATFAASGTTAIDQVNLSALTGGTLRLTGATRYDPKGITSFFPMIQADGTGSHIDLSAVTTLRGAGNAGDDTRVNVYATNGGSIDMSHVAQISVGNIYFLAQNSGAINLAALTSFRGAASDNARGSGPNWLDAEGGGAHIDAPLLTSLTDVDLGLAGTATLPVSHLTTLAYGQAVALGGGHLTLPFTTIDDSGLTGFIPQFGADGAGSRLDLSATTSWRGAGTATDGTFIRVNAFNGGVVDLSHLTQISMGNTQFHAQDGGQINLTALTSFSGSDANYSYLYANRGGAAITAPNLTNVTGVGLQVGGNAFLPVAHLTRFANADLYAGRDGGVGGHLSLPVAVIDFSRFTIYSPTFQADGAGSQLDLSAVTTWRGAGTASNTTRLNVEADNGGVVDLHALTQINTGNTAFITQSGTGNQINLSGLTSFTGAVAGGSADFLEALNGSTILLNSGLVTVSNVTVVLNTPATLAAGTLQLSTGSSLSTSGTIIGNLVNGTTIAITAAGDGLLVTGNYTQMGNLTGAGTLNVNGLVTWASGTMGSSGVVNATGGLSLSGSTTKTLDGRTLNDGGTGTWTGTGDLVLGHGAALNLLGSAMLDIQNDQSIINTLGGGAAVTNAGMLKKSAGTGTTTIAVAFTNSSTVQVQTATLSLTGTFTNFAGSTLTGGTYLLGGILQFAGANIVTNAATPSCSMAAAPGSPIRTATMPWQTSP